jgi:hypothetical protein
MLEFERVLTHFAYVDRPSHAEFAARVTPEEAAADWAQKLSGSGDRIRRGIERVQTAPGILAARQAEKYRTRVVQSVPKWQERVASVGLGEWQRAAIEKGVPRIATGAQAAQPKVAQFMSELLPFQDRLKAQIDRMPSTTLDDNIQRMTTFVRGMAQFRRGGGS